MQDFYKIARPAKKSKKIWGSVGIFFITNRAVDESVVNAEEFNYDAYFSNKIDTGIVIGQACATFPTSRKPGYQDTGGNASLENPARSILLKHTNYFSSTEEMMIKMKLDSNGGNSDYTCPEESPSRADNVPLLYIHGWLATFTSALTRAAQLKIDLNKNNMIVISWPSDQTGPLGYFNASNLEYQSSPLIDYTLGQLNLAYGGHPDVIAHSMGAKLYFDGILSLHGKADEKINPAATRPNRTILAAADVSQSDFYAKMGNFLPYNTSTTAYCAPDLALLLSGIYHFFDNRLGYCENNLYQEGRFDKVFVDGRVTDFWNHSYFLNSFEMVEDMKKVLSGDNSGIDNNGDLRRLSMRKIMINSTRPPHLIPLR